MEFFKDFVQNEYQFEQSVKMFKSVFCTTSVLEKCLQQNSCWSSKKVLWIWNTFTMIGVVQNTDFRI